MCSKRSHKSMGLSRSTTVNASCVYLSNCYAFVSVGCVFKSRLLLLEGPGFPAALCLQSVKSREERAPCKDEASGWRTLGWFSPADYG